MDLLTFIRDYWPVLLGIGFVIAWCARLETKMQSLTEDHKAHKDTIWAKMDGIQISLHQLIAGVAKVEGKLEAKKDHD